MGAVENVCAASLGVSGGHVHRGGGALSACISYRMCVKQRTASLQPHFVSNVASVVYSFRCMWGSCRPRMRSRPFRAVLHALAASRAWRRVLHLSGIWGQSDRGELRHSYTLTLLATQTAPISNDLVSTRQPSLYT